MSRLNSYLVRLFSGEALVLFAVVSVLLFLIQTLRLFDDIAAKGQGFVTLIGQSLLGMPDILVAFLYIIFGIALGRALRGLEDRGELQIIHSSQLIPGLVKSVLTFSLGGTVLLLLLSHFIDPISLRTSSNWSNSIAANFVSQTLVPHQFNEIERGVTLVIGSRDRQGVIGDFFADDRRAPDTRRTYIAKTADLVEDADGYILRLHDGVVQYMTSDKEFSEISFDRYDLALNRITGGGQVKDSLAQVTTPQLIADALTAGAFDDDTTRAIIRRTVEGLRVVALCLFVTAIAAFPNGKRRRFIFPIELTALAAAFIERGISSYAPLPGGYGAASGSILLLGVAIIMLAIKLRTFQPVRIRRAAA